MLISKADEFLISAQINTFRVFNRKEISLTQDRVVA